MSDSSDQRNYRGIKLQNTEGVFDTLVLKFILLQ